MKVNINLLQESQKIKSRLRRLGILTQTISIITLVIFGGIVFVLLSYTLLLKSKHSKAEEEISAKKEIIQSLRSVETKQLLIKRKLKVIGNTIEEHGVRDELVTELYNFAQSFVFINGIQASENTGKLDFNGKASDVFSLVFFIDELIGFSKEKGISKIDGNRFSRDNNGVYDFNITLYFD